MAGTLQTNIVFNGIDRVSRVIGGIQGAINGAVGGISRAGQRIRSAGFATSAAVSAPIVAATSSILNAQETFERAQNELRRRSTITNEETLNVFKDQADRLAAITKYTAAEITNLQTELFSAGLDKDIVKAITPGTTFGSIAADMDPRTFADQLTNMAMSYHGVIEGAEQWRDATDEIMESLALVAASSNTTFSQASNSFLQFGAIAKQIGLDVKTTAGLIGGMANVGFKDSTSGRALRTGMLRSLMLTPKAMRLMRQEGINFMEWMDVDESKMTADRFVKSVQGVAPEIKKHMGRINEFFSQGKEGIIGNFADFQTELANAMGLKGQDAAKLENRIAEFVQLGTGNLDLQKFLQNLAKMPAALRKEVVTMFQTGKFSALVSGGDGTAIMDDVLKTMNLKREEILKKINPLTGEKFQTVVEFMAMQEMRGLPGALDVLKAVFDRFQRALYTSFDYKDKDGMTKNHITEMVWGLSDKLNEITEKLSPVTVRIMAIGAAIAAIGGPFLIYFGLAAQGLAALLKLIALLLSPIMKLTRLASLLSVALFGSGKAALMSVAALARFTVVGAALSAVGYAIYKSWDKITGAFGAVLPNVIFQLKNAFEALRAGDYSAAFDSIGEAFSNLGTAIKRSVGYITDVFREYTVSAAEWLDSLSPDLDTDFLAKFEKIGAAFKNVYESISGLMGGELIDGEGMENLKDLFSLFGRIAEGSIATALDLVAASLNGVANAIRTIVEFTKKIATGDIAGAFQTLADGMATAFNIIIDLANDVIENFTGISNGIDKVVESVKAAWKALTGGGEPEVAKAIEKGASNLAEANIAGATDIHAPFKKMATAGGYGEGTKNPHAPIYTPPPAPPVSLPPLAGVGVHDEFFNKLNNGGYKSEETIGALTRQTQAVENAKAATDLAAKASSETTAAAQDTAAAVRAQTPVLERIAGSIGAINNSGNRASEAPGAPSSPAPISSNGQSGI